MKRKRFLPVVFISMAGILALSVSLGFAENIDPDDDGSQYSYGENVGWLNWEPSQGPGVTVGDYTVTGYLWAENIGRQEILQGEAGESAGIQGQDRLAAVMTAGLMRSERHGQCQRVAFFCESKRGLDGNASCTFFHFECLRGNFASVQV